MDSTDLALANEIFDRIDALAQISEHDQHLTRRSLTEEHKRVNTLVGTWMQKAGMTTRTDAVGNIIGRLEGSSDQSAALLMGSHLDTVRNAGRYDGMLGVVLPLLSLERLQSRGESLPYPVEVVGFCDEEGVRFPSTLIGSRAIAGSLEASVLEESDSDNITVAKALSDFGASGTLASATRRRQEFLGFIECHIEQGPVLERKDLSVGVVTAISGASRFTVTVTGKAGHAGTVPMGLRKDALCAACECILKIESHCTKEPNLVGTVGQLKCLPGAGNVIPGNVEFSLDLRSSIDSHREIATVRINDALATIAKQRQVQIEMQTTYQAAGVVCDSGLSGQLANAITSCGYPLHSMPSGAGHDAAAIADISPVAMLFVRCKDGLSHHPDESIRKEDAAAAANVLIKFLQQFDANA